MTAQTTHASTRLWSADKPAGFVRVVWRLVRTARTTWPRSDPPSIGYASRMLARKLARLRRIHAWFNDPTNPALREMLAVHPFLLSAVGRPYLNATWSAQRRLDTIESHYRMLHGPLAFLRFAPDGLLVLGRVDTGTVAIDIVLDKAPWFSHEGELVLNLFQGEHRLFSLAFTLGCRDGRRYAYVGALQGSGQPGALELYRELTHLLHGLRPRDLLLDAFRLLCRTLRIEQILAVTDSHSAARSAYFGSNAIQANYDSAWTELGGIECDDGFYDVPIELHRRSADEIPSRKRAQYRRRYAMLDALQAQMTGAIAAWQRYDALEADDVHAGSAAHSAPFARPRKVPRMRTPHD